MRLEHLQEQNPRLRFGTKRAPQSAHQRRRGVRKVRGEITPQDRIDVSAQSDFADWSSSKKDALKRRTKYERPDDPQAARLERRRAKAAARQPSADPKSQDWELVPKEGGSFGEAIQELSDVEFAVLYKYFTGTTLTVRG